MGTNYYWTRPQDSAGPLNSDHEIHLHIGKSSFGWCFALASHPDLGILTLADWIPCFFYPGSRIECENGIAYSPGGMLDQIMKRSGTAPPRVKNHDSIDAAPGPNNLLRARIDGCHCVRHGAGTWDIMEGEFF